MISLDRNRYLVTAMIRTLISLEAEDKSWLDRKAEEEGVAMTEIVRLAVRRLRDESEALSFERLLAATSGLWQGEEGLEYQLRIRGEWDDR